jgi:hypothetical protein
VVREARVSPGTNVRDESDGRRAGRNPVLSPEAAALMRRRVEMLIGIVPLPEMSQEEADWVFLQCKRAADE